MHAQDHPAALQQDALEKKRAAPRQISVAVMITRIAGY